MSLLYKIPILWGKSLFYSYFSDPKIHIFQTILPHCLTNCLSLDTVTYVCDDVNVVMVLKQGLMIVLCKFVYVFVFVCMWVCKTTTTELLLLTSRISIIIIIIIKKTKNICCS